MPGNVDLPDGFSDVGLPLKNQSGMRGIFSSSSFRSRPVERMVISTPPFPPFLSLRSCFLHAQH